MRKSPTNDRSSLIRKRRANRKLAHARATGLPTVVMLLSLATAAGQSPRAAIRIAAGFVAVPGAVGVVAADFAQVDERLSLGASLDTAVLESEGDRGYGPEITRVLDVLRRAESDGGSLQMQFEFLIRDLRRHRANALDEAAQRLTVALLFPLVLCILPAFVLLAIAPLLVEALSGLNF